MFRVNNYIPKNLSVYQGFKFDGTIQCAKNLCVVLNIQMVEIRVRYDAILLEFKYKNNYYVVEKNQIVLIHHDWVIEIISQEQLKENYQFIPKKPIATDDDEDGIPEDAPAEYRTKL